MTKSLRAGIKIRPIQVQVPVSSTCQVMLISSEYDEPMPQMLILKGKGKLAGVHMTQLHTVAGDVPFTWQDNAWMDEEVMLHWLIV